ncbi:MAG: hypothetical protein QE271_03240 [Bacteriovoracaceae bacterium]|nr:hypothetical protein [Bacteriovoracaceae bacterium]
MREPQIVINIFPKYEPGFENLDKYPNIIHTGKVSHIFSSGRRGIFYTENREFSFSKLVEGKVLFKMNSKILSTTGNCDGNPHANGEPECDIYTERLFIGTPYKAKDFSDEFEYNYKLDGIEWREIEGDQDYAGNRIKKFELTKRTQENFDDDGIIKKEFCYKSYEFRKF